MDVNDDLYEYLQGARETLLWKLDGLDEYDIRRPMTPTGTNLLGLVKHSARSHLMHFCDVFDRPQDPTLRWLSNVTPGSDIRAKPAESSADVVAALTAETQRHAGHADIVRELIDGSPPSTW